jgi:CRISPR-associated endonuclease/helicase Cas3
MKFDSVFRTAFPGRDCRPYGYQRQLAGLETAEWPDVLMAPTGMGKTAAILLGWFQRRLTAPGSTPRRLVYCLPMRTLVEQTAASAGAWLSALREIDPDALLPDPDSGIHVLMGGEEAGQAIPSWILDPERPALIIGTQDMLLSRALMRGYAMSRTRWPVDFALLHSDALWVFDEVQLMGAGLTTSAQLQGFRRHFGASSAARTLWVSATLAPDWLRTVDHPGPQRVLRVPDDIPADRDDPSVQRLIRARKAVTRADMVPTGGGRKETEAYAATLAREVLERHRPGRTTLVILNRVARAQAVHAALKRLLGEDDDRLVLIHSRFRAPDRAAWAARLPAPRQQVDRIVVATQAVEAGVDMSAAVLFTELAPWPSLAQRFGRANRYAECGEDGAEIRWIDLDTGKADLALPYRPEELDAARLIVASLADAAAAGLPPPGVPPRAGAVIRKKDFIDLFDTDPDLTGFDIDISPFIRDAEDTDIRVFWRDLSEIPAGDQPPPLRDELCAVSIAQARALLDGKRSAWRLDPQGPAVAPRGSGGIGGRRDRPLRPWRPGRRPAGRRRSGERRRHAAGHPVAGRDGTGRRPDGAELGRADAAASGRPWPVPPRLAGGAGPHRRLAGLRGRAAVPRRGRS